MCPQARITDIAKLEGKLDSENGARKAEIAALDSWAKGENDARKTEIENLGRIRFNSILSADTKITFRFLIWDQEIGHRCAKLLCQRLGYASQF